MSTMTRTARSTQFGVGLVAAVVALVTLGLVARPVSSPAPVQVPAAAASTYSQLPSGFTDYEHLQTHPARRNYSAAPDGMTDHPAPAARSNHSALPQGFSDYQTLQPRARVNHSQVPRGFSDYLPLQPKAQVNYSEVPFGMTDHLSPAR